MTEINTASASATFLIVVREILVGQDLAMTIEEERPGAKVIVVATLDAAPAALTDVAALEVAFIAADPARFEHSPLAQMISALGGKIVLMGLWFPEACSAANWKILPFPFTTEDVLGFIST